jgi:hypothetical protein
MKKDVIFSMRMSTEVRDALRKAAKKEHRTTSSLLLKVAMEYLEKEGHFMQERLSEERRRFQRKKVMLPSNTHVDRESKVMDLPGMILDISLGGVLVSYPKISEITSTSIGELSNFELSFKVPSSKEGLCFDCDARRMTDMGSEIQVAATFRDPSGPSLDKLHDSFL